MSLAFVDPETPDPTRLTATDLAQLRHIDALMVGRPVSDKPLLALSPERCTRYRVVADGQHRYDAWIVGGCLPLVVFAPGGAEALAWWSDQDSSAEPFADGDAVWAAYEAALAEREGS